MPAFHGPRGEFDDGEQGAAARMAARPLGVRGVIVRDYNAIAEIMRHGIAADIAEEALTPKAGGVDID